MNLAPFLTDGDDPEICVRAEAAIEPYSSSQKKQRFSRVEKSEETEIKRFFHFINMLIQHVNARDMRLPELYRRGLSG